MQDKSKVECCNGDCNQGRDCPIRKEWRKQPFNYKVAWHNFVHAGSFTLMERFFIAVAVILLFLTILRDIP
jgi:hypothetical protein